MSLAAGSRLGPYEIQALIGAGGMGEVYRAKDTRLDRTVALKVLPPHLATDPDQRARFEREARAISSLAHPHICTLHDIGQQDGTPFLVMEYVAGETLATRLHKGPLPIPQVLALGAEIAGALAAAHKAGIVHRDLKPANVMLTKEGVKLLDFGLAAWRAQQVEQAGASAVSLPTRSDTLTAQGTILGTLPYMAPEQLEGRDTDTRTDVWALGCVLHEMATGRRAFTGSTDASLITAIMSAESTPLGTLQPLTPPTLEHVVRQCLAKDPEDRWQSAADVARELGWVAESSVSAGGLMDRRGAQDGVDQRHATRPLSWLRRLAVVAMVASALALGMFMGLRLTRSTRSDSPHGAVVRSSLSLPPDAHLDPAFGTDLAISPDGSRLAWIGHAAPDRPGTLFVLPLSGGVAHPVSGTTGAAQPLFSPDGKWIAFLSRDAAGSRLRKVPADGGLVVDLADISDQATSAMGGSWAADGRIVLGSDWSGLFSVSANGGKPQGLTTPDSVRETGHRSPFVLPGGRAVLFTARPDVFGLRARVEVFVPASRARKVLIEDCADARLLATGHLVCTRRGTLVAAPFDLDRLELKGPAVPVLEGVRQLLNTGSSETNSGATEIAVSSAGLLVYARGGITQDPVGELILVDERGRAEPLRGFNHPLTTAQVRFSPDGRRVAFTEMASSGLLWVFDTERGTSLPLSHDGIAGFPVWSPDGSQLAVSWSAAGRQTLWLVPAEGTGEWTQLTGAVGLPSSWSSDGERLAFFDGDRDGISIYELTNRRVVPFLPSGAFPEFSPDGRWLAYVLDVAGRPEVYVTSFPDRKQTLAVSSGGGHQPVWSRDRRRLFYRSAAAEVREVVVRVDGGRINVSPSRPLFAAPYGGHRPVRGWDVRPDGRAFLFKRYTPTKPTPPATELALVHNWFTELERLCPTKR